jgi:hypothetical protein
MTTEPLHWHPASELPDADITVLCWSDDEGFFCGYWDGVSWITCVDGMEIDTVTHWSSPNGPTA